MITPNALSKDRSMRHVTVLAFLLLGTQLVSAQTFKNFGIKAGYNRSFIDAGSLQQGVEGMHRHGFHAGVFKEFQIKNWSIVPGLLYSVKGFRVSARPPSTPPGVNSITGTRTFKYLELPVNLLYNFKIKPGKLFVGGGPYVGYLLAANGHNTRNVGGNDIYTETKFDIGGSGTYKRFDMGVNFVVGIKLKSGLLFNLAAYNGFTNILATTGNFPPITKNRALTLSAGYEF